MKLLLKATMLTVQKYKKRTLLKGQKLHGKGLSLVIS